MNNISDEIVDFFYEFDKYKVYNRKQIADHVNKSIENNWYRIQRKDNKIISYTDWVYLDEKDSKFFLDTGCVYNHFYKGEIGQCFIKDSLYKDKTFWRDIKVWVHEYFFKEKKLLNVKWLRTKGFKVDYIKTLYPKESDV